MHPLLLNLVWPALYVSETFYRFWMLIVGTILVEAVVLMLSTRIPPGRCVRIAVVGNLASGIAGTFIMTLAMILWHLVADTLFFDGTFNPVNWVATFVLMCLGSVWIECWTVKLIFKEPVRRMFLPLMVGNALSYALIAWMMVESHRL